MKRFLLLIAIGATVVVCSVVGFKKIFASETVLHYDGSVKEFSYSNLDSDDLFNDFKDLIPGDKRSQKLRIKAHSIDTETKLYLKLNRTINSQLLSYVNIYCYADGVLLEENDDMMLIKNFNNDSDIELEIIVEVPIEVGNEAAGFSHSLMWTFVAEESGQEVAGSPETGRSVTVMDDLHENIFWLILLIIGLGIFACGIANVIKKQKR